jgi:hypothetical protein
MIVVVLVKLKGPELRLRRKRPFFPIVIADVEAVPASQRLTKMFNGK